MKKVKYLVLSTALATMLMGAGYAAWTDGFKVKNTVEAGELKVSLLAAQEMYDADFKNPSVWKTKPELKDNVDMKHNSHTNKFDLKMGQNKELTINQEDKSVSFNFQNLYPGCTATTQLSAKNDGTMPAVIGAVDVSDFIYKKSGEKVDNSELAAKMLVDYEFVVFNADNYLPRVTIKSPAEGVALADLEASLQRDLEGVYLLPGEEFGWNEDKTNENGFGYTLKFRIPETLGTEQNPDEGENESIEFDIDFDFVQHNMFEGAVNPNN